MDMALRHPQEPAGMNGFGRSGAVASSLRGGPQAPTRASFATAGRSETAAADGEYRPGVCNIGPAEIRRRRRAGHVGLVATIVLLGALVAIGVPPVDRLIVALPAATAASGYLQAWLKFCAGFGSRGLFNFGSLGETQQVVEPDARARDRARATQIAAASLAVGVAAAVVAVLLPL
jgi:hypothetical protein